MTIFSPDVAVAATISIDVPRSADIETVSKWISDTGEVTLISDLQSNILTTHELERWLETCVVSTVVRADRHPIAFATVSVKEALLPSQAAEICHLIVHPKWRRQYNASHLVLHLMLSARSIGFTKVVGRVVPHNALAHAFLGSLRWVPVPPNDSWATPGFVWYQRRLADA